MGGEVLSGVMTKQTLTKSNARYAVRIAPNVVDRRSIEHQLKEHGATDLTWFDAKDDDELNQLASDGRFDVLVYERIDLLLTAIWKGDVDWPEWMRRGVRVEFASTVDDSPHDLKADIARVVESYSTWRCAERRRQIVACLLLSVAGLVALVVLLQATPLSR